MTRFFHLQLRSTRSFIHAVLLSIAWLTVFSLDGGAQKKQAVPAALPDSTIINNLPAIPFLPDPLLQGEGTKNVPIRTLSQWQQKREWIRKQYMHWVSGTVPPAPGTVHSRILSEITNEDGVTLRTVVLSFGPGDRAHMTLELMLPPHRQSKPLPVFITPWNHRGWAQVAVRRGYIACVYAGADAKDDTRNYHEVYPDYDFATLMKRAWGCSRAVDYLYTLSIVDTARIALTGHSRNGKQSLMAAAFDSRIKAVVSSSGGTGGESTFRFSDDRFNSESVEEITRNFPDWFSPRLSLFAGREQRLPVDQNSLMALIAPRGLMMVSAITEQQGNPWGIEQSFRSVKKAYHFLHADSAVAILLRHGRHQHAARDIEDFLDFFDYIFGRSSVRPENKLYAGYSFENWKTRSGEHIEALRFPKARGRRPGNIFTDPAAFAALQDSLRKNIDWIMGIKPPGVSADKSFSPVMNQNQSYPDDYLSEVIGQVTFSPGEDIRVMRIGPYHALGDDLWGAVFFPPGSVVHDSVAGKVPLVIYLHGYSYATGFHRRSSGTIKSFLDAGYAVLAFDLVGFGTRVEEALHFYDRYPHWSKMGNMVEDTRHIISDACNRMPFVDTSRIIVAGYALGGQVALLTAALDKRVKGAAAIAAFSSLRNDNTGTEGIRHFYELHGLLPRLGFFAGREERIPADFTDILSCIAPRPVCIIAPERDRQHHISYVREAIAVAGDIYGQFNRRDQLTFKSPDTYNHFTPEMQQEVKEWLQKIKKD